MALTSTQDSSLSDIMNSAKESFSLRENGNWIGSNTLMNSVKTLRANNPSNAKACTHAGWGNSNSGGGGGCRYGGWTD